MHAGLESKCQLNHSAGLGKTTAEELAPAPLYKPMNDLQSLLHFETASRTWICASVELNADFVGLAKSVAACPQPMAVVKEAATGAGVE